MSTGLEVEIECHRCGHHLYGEDNLDAQVSLYLHENDDVGCVDPLDTPESTV